MSSELNEYPLEDCLEVLIDYRGKSPRKSETGIPVISAKVVKDGRILEPVKQTIDPNYYSEWMRRGLPQVGDIVMTTEAPLGEIARLTNKTAQYALGQRIVTMRGRKGRLDNGFFKYLMLSHEMQDRLYRRATGTTVLGISQKALRSVLLPLPDFDVQRSASKILGDLDDKIDILREMNKTLEEISRSLFRAWFVDFKPVRAKATGATSFRGMPQELFEALSDSFEDSEIGEIPKGWEVGPLACLVRKPLRRGLAPKYISSGGICVLNQKCIRNHVVNFGLARRHNSAAKPPKDRVIELHDILVNSTGVGTLGRVAQVSGLDEETIVDSHLSVVNPDPEKIDPIFLGFNLTEREAEIENLSHGSTGQTELSKHRLGELKVLMPIRIYQDVYSDLISPMICRSVLNYKKMETLAALRDTLLPKLISGEIEAPDLEALADGG